MQPPGCTANRNVENRHSLQLNYTNGEKTMKNYKEMYLILFNAITDAAKILTEAQKKVEELYINQE